MHPLPLSFQGMWGNCETELCFKGDEIACQWLISAQKLLLVTDAAQSIWWLSSWSGNFFSKQTVDGDCSFVRNTSYSEWLSEANMHHWWPSQTRWYYDASWCYSLSAMPVLLLRCLCGVDVRWSAGTSRVRLAVNNHGSFGLQPFQFFLGSTYLLTRDTALCQCSDVHTLWWHSHFIVVWLQHLEYKILQHNCQDHGHTWLAVHVTRGTAPLTVAINSSIA